MCDALLFQARNDEALSHAKMAYAIWEKLHTAPDHRLATGLDHLAMAYLRLRNKRDALEYSTRALEMDKAFLDTDIRKRLERMKRQTQALKLNGKNQEAEHLAERTLNLASKVFGESSSGTSGKPI